MDQTISRQMARPGHQRPPVHGAMPGIRPTQRPVPRRARGAMLPARGGLAEASLSADMTGIFGTPLGEQPLCPNCTTLMTSAGSALRRSNEFEFSLVSAMFAPKAGIGRFRLLPAIGNSGV